MCRSYQWIVASTFWWLLYECSVQRVSMSTWSVLSENARQEGSTQRYAATADYNDHGGHLASCLRSHTLMPQPLAPKVEAML